MPYFNRFLVVVGTPQIIGLSNVPAPVTLSAQPGVGGSMLVEYSTSPEATTSPNDTAKTFWQAWPAGTVSVAKTDGVTSPLTAVRATAITASGYFEVVGSN